MEFINKCNQVQFRPFYLHFENIRWNSVLPFFIKYDYKNFSPIKSDIRELLIDEQLGRCCYCLKILEKNSSTTLEHIYPRNPHPTTALSSYSITCVECRAFDYSVKTIPNIKLDNLPHDISYFNLLACCEKCNKERSNKDILPFIFDISVKTKFLYDNQGNIFSQQYFKEIVAIGLADSYYKSNRKIWRHIKNNLTQNISLNDLIELKKVIKTAASELYLTNNDTFYLKLISDEDAVNDTIKYIYFYDN